MLKRISFVKIVVIFFICITFGGLQTVSAAVLGPLVQVSYASPFGALTNCGNFPGIFNGINFLDSEVEPWLSVNPSNPNNIVAFWQ
jgi:hypothetical protein